MTTPRTIGFNGNLTKTSIDRELFTIFDVHIWKSPQVTIGNTVYSRC